MTNISCYGGSTMKKIMLIMILCVVTTLLLGCGKLSDDVKLKKTKVEVGSKVKLNDLFKCSNGVTIGFKNEDNFNINKVGKYAMQASLQKGDDTQDITYNIEVVDTKAPKILAGDVKIFEGEKYKIDTSCEDNSGESIKAKVIKNNVNNKKAGTYLVKYEAKDSSGNKSTKEVKVTVLKVYSYKDVKNIVKRLLKKNKYNLLQTDMDKNDETIFISSKGKNRTFGDVQTKMGLCINQVVLVLFNTKKKVETVPRIDYFSNSTEGYNKCDRIYVTGSGGKVRFNNLDVDMDYEMYDLVAVDETISKMALDDNKSIDKFMKIIRQNNVKEKIYADGGELKYVFNSSEKKYLKQLASFYEEFWKAIS